MKTCKPSKDYKELSFLISLLILCGCGFTFAMYLALTQIGFKSVGILLLIFSAPYVLAVPISYILYYLDRR